jgi:hypothetical protein
VNPFWGWKRQKNVLSMSPVAFSTIFSSTWSEVRS